MSLFAVGSAKGSPGATAVALALVRELAEEGPDRDAPILVDADPDGGDIALRVGLDPVPGIGTLALAGRHGLDEATLLAHTQRSRSLPGVHIVPGVAGRAQAATLDWVAPPLAELAPRCDRVVVADIGRVGTAGPTRDLLVAADVVLVVCREDTPSVVHARSAMAALGAAGIVARAVVVGPGRQRAEELAAALLHDVAATVGPEPPGGPIRRPAGRQSPAMRRLADYVLGLAGAEAASPVVATEPVPEAVASAAMAIPSRAAAVR